ncbi:pentapeptide repeat-containing protein [Macrococcoides canis]|uniref:pentapeptide repeat-containing protein n=1 Tax=Macrococcoides canis TaxID=1855823 RepID=UPI001AEC0BDA|nr:pentapeptide repeat-containing protein [Macrococcus canis]QTQ07909.1 pentapeptide repeat-containing protein [Macrococcus canis]
MKIKSPQHKTIESIHDKTITLTRDDYGMHYSNCTILFDSDLREIDDIIFIKCTFTSDIYNIHLTDVTIDSCMMQNMTFEDVSFRRVYIKDTLMTGFTLNNVHLKDVHFNQTKMNLFNIADSIFDHVHFDTIDGHDGYLYHIETKKWAITQSQLNGLSIVETSLNTIDLSESDIDGISVRANDLKGCSVNSIQSTALIQLFGIKVK